MATPPKTTMKNFTASVRNISANNLNKSSIEDEDFDCVKVEISDLDGACLNPTTVSLIRCKKQILVPFRGLLYVIGWRPFGADTWSQSSIYLRVINVVYPLFILFLLLFNYTYEIIICQGKLNVAVDTKTTTTTTTTTEMTTTDSGRNYSIIPWDPLHPGIIKPKNSTLATIQPHAYCGHIFTTYILPDIFHFIAFIIGFIHFRVTEGEPMYSLMEKAVIHADENMRSFSPTRAIRRLKIFMLLGLFWMIVSIATHALSNAMNDFAHVFLFNDVQYHVEAGGYWGTMRYALFTLDIICLFISNCVHVAVVINYICHCELIVFYCKSIRTRLEEKSMEIQEAMKRILDLGASVSQLNSAAARMMSILLIYFLERSILGIILLVLNRVMVPIMWIYRSLYAVVWISILLFCIGQAARVTSKCDKFHRIALGMRVYGYHTCNQNELDGFLLFLSKANLRAKLFGLVIRPGKIILVCVVALLVLVCLFQTNLVSSANFFF